MSRIVICSREWSGSTGRYAQRLVQNLAIMDKENEYIVLVKPKDAQNLHVENPNFSVVASPHSEFSLDEQFGLKKQITELLPDLVHFTMVQQPIWYKGPVVTTMQDLTTIRFRNLAKNPLVFTFKQQVYKWVNKKAAKKSRTIITPSDFVKKDVAKFTGVNPDKIQVIYDAADKITDSPEPVTSLTSGTFILYVGRPMVHKNLPRLIEAFSELRVTHPDLYLVLAGKKDANYQQIEMGVKAQALEHVVFTDFVTEGQLRWLYENCAAYIFPSLSEGFGLPGLEAMAHGAPVVSSNATCLPEVFGPAAHYFDPLKPADIAQKIAEVLDNPALRKELIKAGDTQVSKYSWRHMAEQTLAVYNKALAK